MYTLSYKKEDSCLCVEPASKSLFRVVRAVVKGQELPKQNLEELVLKAEAYGDEPERMKGLGRSHAFPSSPVSICSIKDENVPSEFISSEVVARLREMVFSHPKLNICIPKPLKEVHDPILISIEGNIGAGKTTLFNRLRESHPEWTFIEEPVDFWSTLKNSKGQSLFELYYNNKERWSYTFQNCAVLSRYQYIEDSISRQKAASSGRQVFITERCLDTDHKVFAQMLHDDGKMDSLEFSLYERWVNQLKKTSTPLSGVIYIDTPATICADRIKGRNRDGEEGIPLEYLHSLQKYQSSWIQDLDDPVPIVRTCTVHDVEAFIGNIVSRRI